ncbi:MAG TPA: hypothetical protein VG604_00755 [Candidatus Saccharimonadales bacterium]|nr:hypothetical protein [Candidatus Saccharimonadales bacterium]
MLIGAFFSWWYGRGWQHAAGGLGRRLLAISEQFSVKQLSRTLFQPWRRITTAPGSSLDDKLRAMVDNLVSRCVGFVVRSLVLAGATLSMLLVGVLTIVEILVWPLLPLAAVALIVKGLM